MASLTPSTAGHDPAGKPASTLAAWLAVLSVAIGAFALVTTEFLPVGLLPAIAADLGITDGQAGLMVTMPGILAAFAAPAVTVAAGRLDRRYVLLGFMTLLFISNIAVAFADSFLALLIGRLLLGIGVGGFWVIGVAVGPRLMPWAAVRATSLIFAGVSLGTVAGVPAGSLVGELMGWRTAFQAAAGIAVLVFAAQFFFLPQLPTAKATRMRDLPVLIKVPKARIGLIATLLLFTGQFAAYTYISPFLIDISGISIGNVTALLLVYGLTGFIGNIGGGWVAARDVRLGLIGTSALLGLAILSLPLFGADKIAASVTVAVWGLAFGALPISIQTWMFRAAPEELETGAAIFVSAAQVALAGGALVGGLFVDHLGVPSAMWLGAVLFFANVLLIATFGRGPMVVPSLAQQGRIKQPAE
ncbi:MAG: MFS transporter [Proteobacteria bacterium]|nr:MFS transporter [Pseudomonadota bacterium]